MERYLVKLNELSEKNKYIEGIIAEIEDSVLILSNLMNTYLWISPSKDKLNIKYNEYVESLNKMVNNLKSSLNITKKYQDNYKKGYTEIKNDLEKLSEELEEENEEYRIFYIKHSGVQEKL